ncbi:MAG: PHP domain-containing protein [Lawsonibacter sp.]|nr:PHP domain-containing protein [Lawsonibacter sp.]
MYLADYHTHTCCSMDSEAPLEREAERAAALGLRELCTTDHWDLLDEAGGRGRPLDWGPVLEQYRRASAGAPEGLRLRLGVELGNAAEDPGRVRETLAAAPVDFVIGSVHNQSSAAGGRDLYFLEYAGPEDCRRVLEDYLDSLERTAELPDCYDVLGHVLYPLRYMAGVPGGPSGLEGCRERLRAVLAAAVRAGRGIEVNTYRGRTLEEWRPVLELYRECGGEIVTLGSDAHAAEDVGRGIARAQELLKEAGFRYQAVYSRRTPQFIRL